ncbi:MAG: Glu/Leu/Phe/Val dehydrogenase [Arenicellales bacterium]
MNDQTFQFCDELGPKIIAHVYEPKADLRGIVVVDNVAVGPSIGGLRMAPDVSMQECLRLARAMTYKNAAAGLPHGGGKSVIFADPAMDAARKERTIRAFAHAIETMTDYIVGPDMGTNETAMAWVLDEIGRAVGLPRELGGIPLDEIGATGFGLTASVEVAYQHLNLELAGARVVVQGFGSVGKHAARFLAAKGALLVAAADSSGTIHDAGGFDVEKLIAFKNEGRRLGDFPGGRKLGRDRVIAVDCDILVPAARPDVIRGDNQEQVKANLIAQGANIGVTAEAERLLHERGVLCLPDFISNAGGVICAAVEYHGGSQAQAFSEIEEKIRTNTGEVLERAARQELMPREAAVEMAGDRIRAAMALRRWSS